MLVQVKNLTKVYGDKVAVNGLNLEIEAGSFTAILGPNGAGKSTTIQMLIGLLQPTSGQIIYAEQTKLGVVFQNSVLDANLTVVENLQIRAKQYKQVETGKIEQLIEQTSENDLYHIVWYQTKTSGREYTMARIIELNTVAPLRNARGRLRRVMKERG